MILKWKDKTLVLDLLIDIFTEAYTRFEQDENHVFLTRIYAIAVRKNFINKFDKHKIGKSEIEVFTASLFYLYAQTSDSYYRKCAEIYLSTLTDIAGELKEGEYLTCVD